MRVCTVIWVDQVALYRVVVVRVPRGCGSARHHGRHSEYPAWAGWDVVNSVRRVSECAPGRTFLMPALEKEPLPNTVGFPLL
jgi:hypothetical protein